MATYKVAQDVEADDKLLGPFTARQFIYLIIVAMAGFLAYFLSTIFMPLMIIPAPIILFFGALALPLRKDQPMEVYLAAMVSFYLKPRKRMWIPDGIESLVEITAPKLVEKHLIKDLTQAETEQRLGYLASIVDTQGWAIRHVATPETTSMISDVYNAAQNAVDPLDNNGDIAHNFDSMITEANERRRQEIVERMRSPAPAEPSQLVVEPAVMATPTPSLTPVEQAVSTPAPVAATMQPSDIHFNPYPTIHQSVVQPLAADDQTATAPAAAVTTEPTESTSETAVSPDIINLVNNSNLSVETIAREAHRILDKDDGDEVVISLR